MPVSPSITTYVGRRDILASSNYTPATYTVDKDYVSPVTLADGTTREILWEGTVMALNPANNLIVPNYTSYGFSAIGPLLASVDVEEADQVGTIVWRGDVIEDYCSDNGTFGAVLAATKTTLSNRIEFVSEARL